MENKNLNIDDMINVTKVEITGDKEQGGIGAYYNITVKAEFGEIASTEQSMTVFGRSRSDVAKKYKALIERMKEQTVKTVKELVTAQQNAG